MTCSHLYRASLCFLLALGAGVMGACGRGPGAPVSPPAAPAPASPAPREAASVEELAIYAVQGRITGYDSPTLPGWSVGILEFRPTDPEVTVVASARPDSGGHFSIPFSSYRWDIPYALIAFQDANGNGQVDRGEDFVGGESRLGDYRGRNLFLIARAGTFVGDRPLELEDAEFVLDIRAQ